MSSHYLAIRQVALHRPHRSSPSPPCQRSPFSFPLSYPVIPVPLPHPLLPLFSSQVFIYDRFRSPQEVGNGTGSLGLIPFFRRSPKQSSATSVTIIPARRGCYPSRSICLCGRCRVLILPVSPCLALAGEALLNRSRLSLSFFFKPLTPTPCFRFSTLTSLLSSGFPRFLPSSANASCRAPPWFWPRTNSPPIWLFLPTSSCPA